MVHKFIFIIYLLLMCSYCSAQNIVVHFQSHYNNPTISNTTHHPKSPIQPPTVYIEDYTLTFQTDHPDYTLYIKDEDGIVVYTTTVYSAQTQVTLPSTLSGDYEIELVMGNWMFTGWITL